MIKMSQIIKDTKDIDMSAGSTTVVRDMDVGDDSLEIMTIDHDDPYSGLHVTKRDINMQNIHTTIELI